MRTFLLFPVSEVGGRLSEERVAGPCLFGGLLKIGVSMELQHLSGRDPDFPVDTAIFRPQTFGTRAGFEPATFPFRRSIYYLFVLPRASISSVAPHRVLSPARQPVPSPLDLEPVHCRASQFQVKCRHCFKGYPNVPIIGSVRHRRAQQQPGLSACSYAIDHEREGVRSFSRVRRSLLCFCRP